MAEDDTPKRTDEDEEPPQVAVPSHDPLPLPPDVSFTRPTLGAATPTNRPLGDYANPSSSDAKGSPGPPLGAKVGVGLASGLTFGASVVGGILVGDWLDHRFPHISPWGTIVLLLVGIAAGFLNIYRLLNSTGHNG